MAKIKGEHLEKGLLEFLKETDLEDVSTSGIFDSHKMKEALADFLEVNFASEPDGDRQILIYAKSEEEAREKFNNIMKAFEDG